MSPTAVTYVLAVAVWFVTALYGVLASQAFIQEQFLTPQLFDPLTIFAKWHAVISLVALVLWGAVRIWASTRALRIWTYAVGSIWLAATGLLAIAAPLAERHTTAAALTISGTGVFLILLVASVELCFFRKPHSVPVRDRSRADLLACLLAAASVTIVHAGAALWLDRSPTGAVADFLQSLRLQLLVGAVVFLALVAIRGAAAWSARFVVAEAALTAIMLAAALTVFVSATFLKSLSIDGFHAVAVGLGLGTALACAIAARGGAANVPDDGVIRALSALSPRLTAQWWGFTVWTTCLLALAVAIGTASRTADWNFLLLRAGIVMIWLLALSAALTFSRRLGDGGARASFVFVALMLIAHIALQSGVAPVHASALRNPSGRWLAEILEGEIQADGVADLVRFLHARTNIPRDVHVEAVDVDLARLDDTPVMQHPHVFLFVMDSLRRDYLAPYNPAVTFTPSIAALANDSLVFRNAFTQYGATGLSVPALWVGGALLHKQYVSSFPRMNALAKLLAHEHYDQWIGMEHITSVILPPADTRAPLDAGVPVKDFRLCKTLAEIRSRLATRPETAPPIFAYSLPQDIHVSVVTREGARAIDEGDYSGFYAPVASRIRRFDACLGEFVDDLKARGLYDNSVIILTSDHGDSLGEEGRMGHAYSLYPEIVRVPLIVHVPPALRNAWSWDEQRTAYSTDITPTLYQLLGHAPAQPAPFFGEPLAHRAGAPSLRRSARMVAASYGAVYGAVLGDATRYYVFDAIAMRERAFVLGDRPEYTEQPVTPELREQGLRVIRDTVSAISSFYRYPTSPDSGP